MPLWNRLATSFSTSSRRPALEAIRKDIGFTCSVDAGQSASVILFSSVLRTTLSLRLHVRDNEPVAHATALRAYQKAQQRDPCFSARDSHCCRLPAHYRDTRHSVSTPVTATRALVRFCAAAAPLLSSESCCMGNGLVVSVFQARDRRSRFAIRSAEEAGSNREDQRASRRLRLHLRAAGTAVDACV